MPNLTEEITSPTMGNLHGGIAELPAAEPEGTSNEAPVSGWRPLRRARTNIGRVADAQRGGESGEYETELVDILDLVGTRVPAINCIGN
jgi:hypothetical protein